MKKPTPLVLWLIIEILVLNAMSALAKEPSRDTASIQPAQILIEAAVLEVKLSDSGAASQAKHQRFLGSGIHWFTNLIAIATNGIGIPTDGFTYVASLGGGLNSTLAALRNNREFEVIQKPRIQTWPGVPASLFIGETIPSVNGTSLGHSGGLHFCRSELKTGIQLEITPTIDSGGAIAMIIKATVERRAKQTKLASIDNHSATTITQYSASVPLSSGDTLLLGGATVSRKTHTPQVYDRGALAHQTQRLRSTELVVLVRTTVLPME